MSWSVSLAVAAIAVSLFSLYVSCRLSVRLQSTAHRFQKKMFRVKSIHEANTKLADSATDFLSLSEIRREQFTEDQLFEEIQKLEALFCEITLLYTANLHLFSEREDDLIEDLLAEFEATRKALPSGDEGEVVERALNCLPIQRKIVNAILGIFHKSLMQILPELDELEK